MESMHALLALAACGLVLAPAAAGAGGRLSFEDTVAARSSTSVRITVRKAAAFRVVLKVPTRARAQLFLEGRTAPKGGPLIDTRSYGCEGATGSLFCRGAYEALPRGTYTWRIRWLGRSPAHVGLTVRW
jgi:hypothetical protein